MSQPESQEAEFEKDKVHHASCLRESTKGQDVHKPWDLVNVKETVRIVWTKPITERVHAHVPPQEILDLEKAASDAKKAVSNAWSNIQDVATKKWQKFAKHCRYVLINAQDTNNSVTACAQWYGFDPDSRRKTSGAVHEYRGVRGIVRELLEECLFRTRRVALSVDATGNPVLFCKSCDINFSPRDHVACTECVAKNRGNLHDMTIWTEYQNNLRNLALIQETLGRKENAEGHICVCVSCEEIKTCSIFSKRKCQEFRGWGTLSDWKNAHVGMVTRDITILDKHMWTNEECLQAQRVMREQDQGGEGKDGESGSRKKKKKKTLVDKEQEEKISDDIVRAVLNLRPGEEDTEGNESTITRQIEEKLEKSEGELLQYSSEIVSIHKSWIRIKKQTREYLEKFPHDQKLSVNVILADLYKESEFEQKIRHHLSVWTQSIIVWVIQCNQELDEISGIRENTSMEGYFSTQGISGDWYKCRVGQKLPIRRNGLAEAFEVDWADGDSRDRRKYRHQLRMSTEVREDGGGAEDDDDATLLSGGVTEIQSQGHDTQSGQVGSQVASRHGTTTQLSDFVLVRETVFSTVRRKIKEKTEKVVQVKPIDWDVNEVTRGVVEETLTCLQMKWADDQELLAVVTDLKLELWEFSETWVMRSMKDWFLNFVQQFSVNMIQDPKMTETVEMDLKKLQELVRNKLGESIASQVLTRYDYLIEDVVSKQWKIHGIVRDGEPGCSQSEEQIIQHDAASRITRRVRIPNTFKKRFEEDTDLLLRVLGTPAEYLVYLTREQIWAMGCCNHTNLHEYLIKESSRTQPSVTGGNQPSSWSCPHCQAEHPVDMPICPNNWDIQSPLYLNKSKSKRVSCPLAVDRKRVRQFYDSEPAGQEIINILGLKEYEVDHVDPWATGGVNHVMNLCLLKPEANKYFSSDKGKLNDKLKLVGGVTKLCCLALKTHMSNFWNKSGMHRHPKVDLGNLRVLESKSDKLIYPQLEFSPYVFALTPPLSWVKIQMCNSGDQEVMNTLHYVQGFEAETCDRTKYSTRGGSDFVKTQHVSSLKSEANNRVEIDVRAFSFKLWSQEEVSAERYKQLNVDPCHFPSGAWVLKFPKLRLVVTLKEGAHLVAGEDIDKGDPVTAYGGTPVTEEELGGCGDCLKNHWGIEGKRLYEMWRSHVKHAVTGNDHACLTSSLAVVGEVLNSIPDRPGQPHDLEYLLVGGLLGGLINSADGKGQENVQWRKILTPLRKDHKGGSRPVSQVCFASKKILEGEEILYKYIYSKVPNVGRWVDGAGEVTVPVDGRALPRRCRQMREYLEVMRELCVKHGHAFPNKLKSGASMMSQHPEYASTARCLYCCEPE